MNQGPMQAPSWAAAPRGQLVTVVRNLSTRYLAIAVETIIGLVMLPFNLAHLGPAAYGLWVLTASVTVHISLLDLGYGGALVKFIAQYRAHRDTRALNEIASTLFFVFSACGIVAYAIAAGLAFNIGHIFNMTAEQAQTARWVLLITAVHVAINFPFSVYGGVVTGFQRMDTNNLTAVVTAVVVAMVNAAVLLAGYGLVTLVAATTAVRVLGYFVYRYNALRIYPQLRLRPSLFRGERLKEVTGFSIYASIIDWGNKLNFHLDQVVIGVILGPAAVAVWAPAERIIYATQRLTNQLNGVLFPVIVDSDASEQRERLQRILVEGTRLSLATVLPIAMTLIVLADPVVHAWLGARAAAVAGCIPIIQILACAVVIRVGSATANTLLKGAGQHKLVAWVNLATGAVNVALSVLLIGPFGLPGVAIGTLIPIAGASLFVLYPAACRRVGLPAARTAVAAVLPALWPAALAGGVLFATSLISSGTLLAVVLQAAAGGALYLALFVVALGRHSRSVYTAKLKELAGRRRSLATAA
jgi:O-antigen/teichoic acid export membrane protein